MKTTDGRYAGSLRLTALAVSLWLPLGVSVPFAGAQERGAPDAASGATRAAPSPAKPLAASIRRHAKPLMRINAGNMAFVPVSERQQDLTRPRIGNGRVVDSLLWPATLVSDADGEQCTATLIGPRTLLTAAHCVGDGATVSLTFKEDGKRYAGVCNRPEQWSAENPSGDWALCRMNQPVERRNMAYEHLRLDPTVAISGRELIVAGYGCTDLQTQAQERPPQLRIGKVLIDRPANEGELWPDWIFTRSARDESSAFICPGDSGGAVYFARGDARYVVAVNSAVQADSGDENYKVSYLAALSTKSAKRFLDAWLKKTGEKVCGYRDAPTGCRRT